MTAVSEVAAERSDGDGPSVTAACVRLLYRHGGATLAGKVVVGLLLALAASQVVPGWKVLLWCFALAAVAAARAVLLIAFRRAQPGDTEIRRWGLWFAGGALASGVLWGCGGVLFLVPGDIELETLVVITLFGVALGMLATYSVHLPAFLAFAPVAVTPLVLALLDKGDTVHALLGLFGLLYVALLLLAARSFNRLFRTSFRLRFNNVGLISELRAAQRLAEAQNEAKSSFLTMISHELRTPLTSVIGFSEILEQETFGPLGDPRYREYAHDIRHSGSLLLDLINDLLDLSKAEAGKLELAEDMVDLRAPVESALRLVRERAQSQGLALSATLPPAPVRLRADERLLRQVLLNLLSNALKFTPAGGGVTVTAALAADGGVAITVTDTGIGMSADEVPLALETFRQLEPSLTSRYKGSGLGLPLARTLAELHGGSLTLASAPGVGTTAVLRLPASRVVMAA